MSNTTKLTLDELVPGDVLVMVGDLRHSNPTRYLDELIMLLTDSDVCHGALFVGKDPQAGYQLIDDALNGVGLRQIDDNDNTQDPKYGQWYVRRMDQPSLQPVVSAAEYYIGRSVYDKTWLVMLGILLAVKDILPSNELERWALKHLKHVFYVIDQHFHKPGTDDFVCSQYVATAFEDAGAEFELKYKAGGLVSNAQPLAALKSQIPSIEPQLLNVAELADVVNGINNLHPELALTTTVNTGVSDVLLNETAHLLVHLINSADDKIKTKILGQAGDYQSAFVSPACLKDGCTNLNDVGMISLGYGE